MSIRQRVIKAQEALKPKEQLRLIWLEDGEEPPPLEPGDEYKRITLVWDLPEAKPSPQAGPDRSGG